MNKVLSSGSKSKIRFIMNVIDRKEKEIESLQEDIVKWKTRLRLAEVRT